MKMNYFWIMNRIITIKVHPARKGSPLRSR